MYSGAPEDLRIAFQGNDLSKRGAAGQTLETSSPRGGNMEMSVLVDRDMTSFLSGKEARSQSVRRDQWGWLVGQDLRKRLCPTVSGSG